MLFAEHLPELVPLLDRLAEQAGRAPARTFLTMAALKPFFSGCTQAGRNGRLLRNYDFAPDQCEATIDVRSPFPAPGHRHAGSGLGAARRHERRGAGGLADLGGHPPAGPGFAVNIVLRYLLETCQTVTEAIDRLRKIPIMLAWNVTLVDAGPGRHRVPSDPTFGPNRRPGRLRGRPPHLPVPDEDERATRTQRRLAAIRAAGGDVAAMLRPPLVDRSLRAGRGAS